MNNANEPEIHPDQVDQNGIRLPYTQSQPTAVNAYSSDSASPDPTAQITPAPSPVLPSYPSVRKTHKLLRILGIVVAAIAVVGAGVGLYAYHQDTKISPCTASATACSVAAALEKLPSDPHSLVPANQEGDVDTASAVPKARV